MTIGMSTFEDFDGVYFSVQALRMYHDTRGCEFLVIDNCPSGKAAGSLISFLAWVPGARYVPYSGVTGTAAARDQIFKHATHDHVLAIDCHVLLEPGSLARLAQYFLENPSTNDLLQGPLVYDDLVTCSTHWTDQWSTGMRGQWATDPRGTSPHLPPFEIQMQGTGLLACRRSAWPGVNPKLRGFGGEEYYIHELFRRRGDRTLCLPFLRWVHRFGRPRGTPYPNIWEDRVRNYLIIADELGMDPAPALAHFRQHLGAAADRIIAQAQA